MDLPQIAAKRLVGGRVHLHAWCVAAERSTEQAWPGYLDHRSKTERVPCSPQRLIPRRKVPQEGRIVRDPVTTEL